MDQLVRESGGASRNRGMDAQGAAQDPVCGMTVDPATARYVQEYGKVRDLDESRGASRSGGT